MKVYTLRLSLRGVRPMVWRRLRVPGVTSLATLHEAIQIIKGWDNDHLQRKIDNFAITVFNIIRLSRLGG